MLGRHQLGRAQLTEQGKVVRDDPDRGDKAVGDGEDIDRAHLDVTVSRRHRAQRRPVRARPGRGGPAHAAVMPWCRTLRNGQKKLSGQRRADHLLFSSGDDRAPAATSTGAYGYVRWIRAFRRSRSGASRALTPSSLTSATITSPTSSWTSLKRPCVFIFWAW